MPMVDCRELGREGLGPEDTHDGHWSVLRLVRLICMHERDALAPDKVNHRRFVAYTRAEDLLPIRVQERRGKVAIRRAATMPLRRHAKPSPRRERDEECTPCCSYAAPKTMLSAVRCSPYSE